MREILKKRFMLWHMLFFFVCGLIIGAEPKEFSVYKDREHWEKSGDIVWEAKVDQKLVALTFDDGPSPTFTGPILDLLGKYKAKATFFMIGKQADKYPEIVLRAFKEGHEIGNHTYNHMEMNMMSEKQMKYELYLTHQTIYRIVHYNMRLLRPTSGFYDEKVVNAAKWFKYTVVIWTWGMDSRDWAQTKPKVINQRIIQAIRPGSIILFHDLGGDRTNTIEALKLVLPDLIEKGYKIVTVSELLNRARLSLK